MNYSSPLAVFKLHNLPRLIALAFVAVIFAGCSKTQPACIDEPTVNLVKEAVVESLEQDLSGSGAQAGLLDLLKKRMQIAVTTIRTSNKDDKIGKVTCEASLEITLANADQIVKDPIFKSMRDIKRLPGDVDTSGPAWKTDIQYIAQHTEDTKQLVIELSGHTPMVHLLSTLAQTGVMDPRQAPAEIPANLLASGNARDAAVRLMNHVYGKQEAEHGCWISRFEGLPYCMKIVQSEIKTFSGGKRLYAIANGQAIDQQGEAMTAHAMQGLVGAFIVGETNGNPAFIAKSTTIQAGTMGTAPSEWILTELGANNNWGWRGEYGDCHQGYCGSRMMILANRAGIVQEVGGIPIAYDDTGACGDCEGKSSSMTSTVRVSDVPENTEFYHLLVAVTGTSNGEELANEWTLAFDNAKGTYITPADWPLDKDF
ncbi:hypothetical protein [Massilia brevitalea]|uniref:hypothetical protein n=1 Tax=Massilia brevitalea TaxID=442526 RepID=UPI0027382F6E|nr:hypothetical protein [Massilia brevitalea]